MILTEQVYRATQKLPRTESYGLTGQMRRASVAIAANIAEGFGREHLGDYLRFLSIANGSVKELETEIIVSARVGLLDRVNARGLLRGAEELGKMLAIMRRRLRAR